MQMRTGALAALLAAWSQAALASSPGSWDGFSPTHQATERGLRLRGEAVLRYLFFKVYSAALYLPDGVAPEEALGDVPRRLEISYHVAIAGKEFGPAADKLLRRYLTEEEMARFRARLDRLDAAYRDVKPGDRYALTYLPGEGTELALNGERLALIDGADFAGAYFAIWLGDHPIDHGLRDSLLGRGRRLETIGRR
jgi:hypothetical protein